MQSQQVGTFGYFLDTPSRYVFLWSQAWCREVVIKGYGWFALGGSRRYKSHASQFARSSTQQRFALAQQLMKHFLLSSCPPHTRFVSCCAWLSYLCPGIYTSTSQYRTRHGNAPTCLPPQPKTEKTPTDLLVHKHEEGCLSRCWCNYY